MNDIFARIDSSFRAAMRGEESTTTLIKKWGIPAFLISYFLIDRAIIGFNNRIFEVAASSFTAIYFAWHIYVLRKCSPKNPKLTKEEKQIQKIQRRKEFWKKTMRKLLLQESISEWNPVKVTMIFDVLFIAQFLGHVFK